MRRRKPRKLLNHASRHELHLVMKGEHRGGIAQAGGAPRWAGLARNNVGRVFATSIWLGPTSRSARPNISVLHRCFDARTYEIRRWQRGFRFHQQRLKEHVVCALSGLEKAVAGQSRWCVDGPRPGGQQNNCTRTHMYRCTTCSRTQ